MTQLTEENLLENGFYFNTKILAYTKDNIDIGWDYQIESDGRHKLCTWIGNIWFELKTVEQLHDLFRLIGRNDLVDNWKNEDKKKIEPKDITFKALFGIGDKFRFTNMADGRSGVYVIVGMDYHILAYEFSDLNKVCSKLTYKLLLKEGYADYAFPVIHRLSEERLAVIEDEKSELIEHGFRFRIEIQKQ